MKSFSNLIFKTKSNGIMFDKDFILKMMPKKKGEHLRGSASAKCERKGNSGNGEMVESYERFFQQL